jgi:chaperone modulatory protein CbpM
MSNPDEALAALVLGESDWIAAADVCQLCRIDLTAVAELVELGVVVSRGPAPDEWLLPATSVQRLRIAGRLIRDLGVNATGAALALELLEAQGALERQVRTLERLVHK